MDRRETTTDCISREQAIEAVTNTIREKFSLADWYEQLVETGLEIENLIKELPPVTPTDKVVDFNNMISAGGRIRNLPPVTPTERTGEWKWESEDICDNCGYEIPHLKRTVGDIVLMDSKDWKYCPNCGEKMRGGTENDR